MTPTGNMMIPHWILDFPILRQTYIYVQGVLRSPQYIHLAFHGSDGQVVCKLLLVSKWWIAVHLMNSNQL
jgi:hypothetical protein